jgi:hypothetical protein
MTAKGDFFPMRINDWVPNMQYAADVRFGGFGTINIPAPAAASGTAYATGLLANAVIGVEMLTTGPFTVDAKFGRNLVLTASGATGASAVYRIRGRDYLGQPMIEDIGVANADGTTPKVGVKAFKYIESIKPFGVTAANAVTLSLGNGTVLGLPYKAQKLMSELVSNVVPANAGTFVGGGLNSLVQTSTTADPRGTYAPHSSVVPDGVRDYELSFMHDTDNLHGNAHYYV